VGPVARLPKAAVGTGRAGRAEGLGMTRARMAGDGMLADSQE